MAEPLTLDPDVKDSFFPEKIVNIATAGVYSREDLDNFLDRLLFPIERQSLLNSVARAMVNEPVKDQKLLMNLVNDDIITSIFKRFWMVVWTDFMMFGQISSGIIMIVMIVQTFIMVIEFFIRGYTLQRIFGWSAKIFAAFFNSLTHLFVALEHNKRTKRFDEQEELNNVVVVPNASEDSKRRIMFDNPLYKGTDTTDNCKLLNFRHAGKIKITESSF